MSEAGRSTSSELSTIHSRRGAWLIAFAVLAAFGLFLRTLVLARQHSLMLDECAVCLNVLHRSMGEFSKTLEYDQAAPIGYLAMQKAVLGSRVANDLETRIVPFAFGTLLIPVMAWLCARIFSPALRNWPALCAFGLVAFNRSSILYGATSKQYAIECFATAILLAVAARVFLRDGQERLQGALSSLVCAPLLMWFSFGAVFVLGGIAATLLLRAVATRQRGHVLEFATFGGSLGVNAVLFYLISARGALANKSLAAMWTDAYLPLWPPARTLQWLVMSFHFAGEAVVHTRVSFLLPVSILFVGVVAFRQRAWFWLAMLCSLGCCLAASALGRYPFNGRLLLFLLPVFSLLLAKAVELVYCHWRWVGIGLAVLMLSAAGEAAAHEILFGHTSLDNVRAVQQAMLARMRTGDQVWVADYSLPCFRYYGEQYPLPAGSGVHLIAPGGMPHLVAGRNWVLVMRTPWKPGDGERILHEAGQQGQTQFAFDAEWTSVRLVSR